MIYKQKRTRLNSGQAPAIQPAPKPQPHPPPGEEATEPLGLAMDISKTSWLP